jgi:hypothetical protein
MKGDDLNRVLILDGLKSMMKIDKNEDEIFILKRNTYFILNSIFDKRNISILLDFAMDSQKELLKDDIIKFCQDLQTRLQGTLKI